jgi:amino acid adenylation domain-containing protein/thioester reductase-like protein
MDAQSLAHLSPAQKRALLADLLRRKAAAHPSQNGSTKNGAVHASDEFVVSPAPREEPLPLSLGQETLWFLDQLEPGNTTYNCPAVVRVTGPLDTEILRRAFEAIVHRHESLRSTFRARGEDRVVEILPPGPLPLELIDLSDLPPEEREARARELSDREGRKSFDLACGPMLRLAVLRLGPLDHVVLMTVHHIAYDGWSTGVLVHEFTALYRAISEGRPLEMPPLPIQYPDFAASQRRWLAEGWLDSQLDYWKEQLRGVPPLLALPTDRPRPQVWTFHGAAVPLTFPQPLVAGLRALGQHEGATLFMTLLAALQTLLHRYTRQDDICIGSPIANRNRAGVERLIGFVVNTLVLRGDLTGNPTFRDLLRRTRETCLAGYAHQDVPFERVMQAVAPNRDARHSSLFQVLFVLQNAPVHIPPLPGLTARMQFDNHNGTAKFDLTLGLTEIPDGLVGILEYNTDLFDRSTAERIAGHFRRLLDEIIVDADRPVAELPLLGDDEEARLVALGEGDRFAGPAGRCIHHLFERHAVATPDAEAVICAAERITYGELNRRANRLAHHLRFRGVGPETPVGLLVEKSAEMVVGVLATLKAGGAYVPLDPALPRERLAVILDDCKPAVVLTQRRLAGDLPFDADRIVILDEEPARAAAGLEENLDSGVRPENLAYIIYTSGSTGTPKGCMIEHKSVVNAFDGWDAAYGLGGLRSTIQMANFAFDVCTGDLVRTLGFGAKLVLCPTEMLLDPERLVTLVREEEVQYAEFVPAVMRPVLRYLEATGQTLAPVKLVVCGSDVWYGGEFRRLRRAIGPQARLINSYGLTEATIDNTYYEGDDELADDGPIPIGRPYVNQRTVVLDAAGRVQPIGVPGELHVGGAGLARGYLNRPDLTAERFIPDPRRTGERLYKSGDLARVLPNGQLELLGRTDTQVKVRGFRIELGEIEATLISHPAVKEAVVVVAIDGGRGVKRLVAYIVPAADVPAPSATDLRAFLGGKLPEYMVPGLFVPLAAVPISANGKVDRNALPAPDLSRPDVAHEYVAPRSDTEAKLSDLWADVLHVERVGVRDSFFELGGHSLVATQLLSRVRAEFGVELPLRKLFEAPVLADFAAAVAAAEHARQGPALAPDRTRKPHAEVPMSFGQQRLWFLDRLEPGNPAYHLSAAVRLAGDLDRPLLQWCVDAIVARHEALRTSFPVTDGRPAAVVAPPARVEIPVTDLSGLPPAEREPRVRALAQEHYRRPFDLGRGPLYRFHLLRLSDREHVALITLHHVVADGWSIGVFLRELGRLYAAGTPGRRETLPPLPVQYADYALWQQAWLAGDLHSRQLAYWTDRLADAAQVLELPTDRPRPPLLSARGATRTRSLSPDLSAAIRRFSQQEGVTPFMTLLAAFQAVLARHAGQDDLLVGTPVANRNRVELEGLVGFFVNTLVLRGDLRGDPTFRELLARTRDDALGAFAHQDLPFEHLVDALKPRRDPSRTPLFQVMFAYETVPAVLHLPGLHLEPVPVDRGTAMFDLTLTVTDDGGELVASAEYNADLYDAVTIARLLRHYETLLARLTVEPDRRVTEVPLADDSERRLVLEDWNNTAVEYPQDCTIHGLIAEQAARTPDAVAVVDAGRTLTYAELNAQADRLAEHLAATGVRSGAIVGLCVERSAEMTVGLLGILKAGAAYLPLDPNYPAERLRFLLADAGARVLLTQSRLRPKLPAFRGTVVSVDTINGEPAGHAAKLASSAAGVGNSSGAAAPGSPDDVAYVIYTSGSTGTPKGVLITHRNLVNLCAGVRRMLDLTPADRVLQFTSLSFDVAAEEIFPAWVTGSAVVLRPVGPVPTGSELMRLVEQHRLTVLELPTAYWHELTAELAADPRPLPATLRVVIVGGETARSDAAARWHRITRGRIAWVNAYGPTETTVTSVAFAPALGTATPTGDVPIGRPLANVRAYVLDAARQPQPVGVPGELFLGGDGVAHGYLNRPELTAERFVPDPFHGGRIYKTGDRARWRADGQLEFLGRIDDQVKVRGFRIEPGEVEAVLARYPGLRQAAVVARPDESGQLQLVAYVVPTAEIESRRTELTAFVRRSLPEYMLPATWVIMPEMPLTAGGKIDRRALPPPPVYRPTREYVAPRTPTERQVAAVWAGLFNVERVGVDDDFFDLGGHSLLAVQLAAGLSRTLGREVSVRSILFYPTVAALAKLFDNGTMLDMAAAWSADSAHGMLDDLGPHVTIERRPLADVIAAGEFGAVEAAAIGYLPAALLPATGLTADQVIHGFCDNRPVVGGIYETDLGRIATLLIPRFDNQLYEDPADLAAILAEAVAEAGRLGAETVSLTGLLPSATDYGRTLVPAMEGRDLPRPTTGHASTTATVVFAIRRLLAETGRDMTRERVAFVGLGSIGASVLRLMLRRLPHPAEIRLCDVYAKQADLAALRREVRDLGYTGPVHLSEARGAVPADVYEATLIVGASNAADILEVDRLMPGALIVDDSAPHCFRPDKAFRRLRERGDILFTEGGTLAAPAPIRQTVFLPPALEAVARAVPRDVLPVLTDPTQITGCIVSSMLSTRFPELPPTVGLVDAPAAVAHYEKLTELGFDAAPLHCEGVVLGGETIAAFRSRFGGPVTLSAVDRKRAAGLWEAGPEPHSPPASIDWSAETLLDSAIAPNGFAPPPAGEPDTILLTGATGFLGAFLLDELLRQTAARIVCPARAGNDAAAGDRIRANLRQYGLDPSGRWDRVVPLAGDLARPQFGLPAERWTQLAAEVGAILHNGAQVHFLHPYPAFRAANVGGTREVLRLATATRLKSVHFVSTLGVFAGAGQGPPPAESDPHESPDDLENGYAQSKWVAEQLVWQAMARGVPGTVLRPGRIGWHSRTGALGTDDVLSRAIRACVQLGSAPDLDTAIELSPVDYVSRAIAAVIGRPQSRGRAYHFGNRRAVRLSELLGWVRAAGYPLQSVPPNEWLRRVQESATHDARDALTALLPLLAMRASLLSGETPLTASGPAVDDRNTQAVLAGTGIECPEMSAEAVAAFLARLAAAGLLAPPPSAKMRLNGRAQANGHARNRPRVQGTK